MSTADTVRHPAKDDEAYALSTRYIKPPGAVPGDGFDQRAAEAKLNRFTHHRIDVGLPRRPSSVSPEPARRRSLVPGARLALMAGGCAGTIVG